MVGEHHLFLAFDKLSQAEFTMYRQKKNFSTTEI